MRLIAGRLGRLRGQDGFTMIATMMALFVVGLLSAAAIAAANGDIHFSRYDQDDKEAYAAAEGGSTTTSPTSSRIPTSGPAARAGTRASRCPAGTR